MRRARIFIRELRFHRGWGMPWRWSIRMAWNATKPLPPKLVAAYREYHARRSADG